MTDPRIVVGVAVFNEERYLRETVPAILAQSFTDFRLILLDNGSTDASADTLWELVEGDKRVTVLYEPVNRGSTHGGNRIWRYALEQWPACEWIVGVGADDVVRRDYLAAILRAADNDPSANLIFSPVDYIGHPERGVTRFPPYNPATVHAEVQIPGWRAVRRDLWERMGEERTRIRIGADWDWVARASVMGLLRPHQLDEVYLSRRVRDDRKSESEQVDWPALHRHLCGVVGQPYPAWARGRK